MFGMNINNEIYKRTKVKCHIVEDGKWHGVQLVSFDKLLELVRQGRVKQTKNAVIVFVNTLIQKEIL